MIRFCEFFRVMIIALVAFYTVSCDIFLPKTSLGNGYYFVTINTTNRYIYREVSGHREEVINANIVASRRKDNYTFALRQPRIDREYETENGAVSVASFLNQCEFYILDITNAKLLGPLNIEEFKRLTETYGGCDHCLHEHTNTEDTNYCVNREEIQDILSN